MSVWGVAREKYEQQFKNGELLGHSELVESYRDSRTLWILIKNRYSGDIVYPTIIEAIFDWAEYIGAKTARSLARNPDTDSWRRHGSMMFCDQYFTAIFPQTDWQASAIRITWGEYFTSRNLDVPQS